MGGGNPMACKVEVMTEQGWLPLRGIKAIRYEIDANNPLGSAMVLTFDAFMLAHLELLTEAERVAIAAATAGEPPPD